jgi:hypothetical protein
LSPYADILEHTRQGVETLVRLGNLIATSRGHVDDLTKCDGLTVTEQDESTAATILQLKAAVDAFNAARVGTDATLHLGLVGCGPSGPVRPDLYRLSSELALHRTSLGRRALSRHRWRLIIVERAERIAQRRRSVGV